MVDLYPSLGGAAAGLSQECFPGRNLGVVLKKLLGRPGSGSAAEFLALPGCFWPREEHQIPWSHPRDAESVSCCVSLRCRDRLIPTRFWICTIYGTLGASSGRGKAQLSSRTVWDGGGTTWDNPGSRREAKNGTRPE